MYVTRHWHWLSWRPCCSAELMKHCHNTSMTVQAVITAVWTPIYLLTYQTLFIEMFINVGWNDWFQLKRNHLRENSISFMFTVMTVINFNSNFCFVNLNYISMLLYDRWLAAIGSLCMEVICSSVFWWRTSGDYKGESINVCCIFTQSFIFMCGWLVFNSTCASYKMCIMDLKTSIVLVLNHWVNRCMNWEEAGIKSRSSYAENDIEEDNVTTT